MEDNKEKEIRKKEDVTKYGEYVPSYFRWITLDKQKQRVKELENITKKIKK